MSYKKVEECIHCLVNPEALTIQACTEFPYGKKLTDDFGDFIIFFYDTAKNQVMYCFKDAEEFCFPCLKH